VPPCFRAPPQRTTRPTPNWSPFVTGRIYTDERRGIRPLSAQVDAGMSALVADLEGRGLLENTLVVWMGEYGRRSRSPSCSAEAQPRRSLAVQSARAESPALCPATGGR